MTDIREQIAADKSPWQFACDWYDVDSIHRELQRLRKGERYRLIPSDHESREFAEWLANEYRLAMNKGIQIGSRWADAALQSLIAKQDAEIERLTRTSQMHPATVQPATSDARGTCGRSRDRRPHSLDESRGH